MTDMDQLVGPLIWTDELIRRFWDGVGCTHLDDLSFGKLAGPKFLRLIRQHLVSGAEICDFGAGSGHFAELLLKDGLATGVYEPSPRRGETLWSKLSRYERFLGVIGPDDARLFDVVIMAEVIEHVPDRVLDQTLERVRRLLRTGGTVIVTTPNDENIVQAQLLCPECRRTFHPWQHVRSYTYQSLEKQLKDYGFARRFVGLIDFSDDAAAIDRNGQFPIFLAVLRLLEEELREFVLRLPRDEIRSTRLEWAAGSVYATDNLQFDHCSVLDEIADLRAQTNAQIRAISWPAEEDALPEALMQFCNEFYWRLWSLIHAQHRLAQVQELTSKTADIVGRFRSLEGAISDMGIAGRVAENGLDFLKPRGSKIYWAARLCWEFLRHPATLAEVIIMPGVLADHARAAAVIGKRAGEPVPGEKSVQGAGAWERAAANQPSGATEGVLVHLRATTERIQLALRAFEDRTAGLGCDLYVGRGSNIVYIGEKV